MSINKEFQVRHGLSVNNTVLTANVLTNRVGVNTSNAQYTLDVSGDVNIANPTLLVAGINVLSSISSSNSYAVQIGAASNAWANSVGVAGNNYVNSVGLAGNNYAIQVGAASNTWANTVGTSGNNYTNSVGVAGNNYTNYVGVSGNNYSIEVGAASNTWANTLSVIDRAIGNSAANSANSYAVTVGVAGNNYSIEVGAASNTWTNTVSVIDRAIANAAANSANAYTITIGAASNVWANAIGVAGNNYTNAVGLAGNNYSIQIGSASNTWANSIGVAGNNYTNSVGVAGNNYTNSVGISGNNYTNSVGVAGNNYSTQVGAASNVWANAIGVAGNSYSIQIGAASNTWANSVGIAGNNYTNSVGLAANNYANATYFQKTGGTISGAVSVAGNFTVTGNLTVTGNTSYVSVENYRVDDPLIYIAGNNYTSDIVDIGIIANYVNTTGSNVHTGLYREHENKEWYLFQGYDAEPDNNHIGPLSNNMTLAVLNADLRTGNLNLGGINAIPWIASAFDKANSANVLAYNTGIGANAYSVSVGAASNTWANTKLSNVIAGGPITVNWSTTGGYTNATINVSTSGVTAATYGNNLYIPVITVDSYGRVTSAFNVAVSSVGGSMDYAYANQIGAASNTWANTKLSNGTVTLAGALTTTGQIYANSQINVTATGGDEGGEIQIQSPGDYTNWSIDAYQNNYRVFARTGTSVSNVNIFHATGGSIRMGVNRTDPTYTVDIGGTINASAIFVNGVQLSTGTVDLTPSNNWANTVSQNWANTRLANVIAGGPITVSWTNTNGYTNATINISTSGVTATTYGGSTNIPVITVDSYGRITSASNIAVQGMDYAYANSIGAASNTWANTLSTTDRAIANDAANSANAYTVTVGTAGNNYAITLVTGVNSNAVNNSVGANGWANTLSTSDRAVANAAANSANAYTVTVGTAGNNYSIEVSAASNTWANTKVASITGTSGQIFVQGTTTPTINLVSTGVSANDYGGATQIPVFKVDTFGRLTYAANVAVQGMDYAYANSIGAASNTWANTVGTAGNNYTITLVTGVNSNAVNNAVGANAWSNTLYVSALQNANTDANSANAFAVTIGAASNTWANTIAQNWANTRLANVVGGGPITVTWSTTSGYTNATINVSTSGVTATSYGSSTIVPTFTVDSYGRITSASNVTISTPGTSVNSAATFASPLAWSSNTFDMYAATALAGNLTINADAGIPVNGKKMVFRFKDNGTTRTLSWANGTANSFRTIGTTFPTATVISKTLYVGCIYNAADSRWDIIAVAQEA